MGIWLAKDEDGTMYAYTREPKEKDYRGAWVKPFGAELDLVPDCSDKPVYIELEERE